MEKLNLKSRIVTFERSLIFNDSFGRNCANLLDEFKYVNKDITFGYLRFNGIDSNNFIDNFIGYYYSENLKPKSEFAIKLTKAVIFAKLKIAQAGYHRYKKDEDYHDIILNDFIDILDILDIKKEIKDECKNSLDDTNQIYLDNLFKYTLFAIIKLLFNLEIESVRKIIYRLIESKEYMMPIKTFETDEDILFNNIIKALDLEDIDIEIKHDLRNVLLKQNKEREVRRRISNSLSMSQDRNKIKDDIEYLYDTYKDKYKYSGKVYHGVSYNSNSIFNSVEDVFNNYNGLVSFSKSRRVSFNFALNSDEYGWIIETELEGLDINEMIKNENLTDLETYDHEQEVLAFLPKKYKIFKLDSMQLKDKGNEDLKYRIEPKDKECLSLKELQEWINFKYDILEIYTNALTKENIKLGTYDEYLQKFCKENEDKLILIEGDVGIDKEFDTDSENISNYLKNNKFDCISRLDDDFEGHWNLRLYKNKVLEEIIKEKGIKVNN